MEVQDNEFYTTLKMSPWTIQGNWDNSEKWLIAFAYSE